MTFDGRGMLGAVAPVLAAALIAATLVLGALKLSGRLERMPANLQASQVVVFDVVKYVNAQRSVASRLLGADANAKLDASTLLMSVSKRVKASISKMAGPGTVVLVRQALIQGDAPDITDAVLRDLGLPTEVPTEAPADVVTGSRSILNPIPNKPLSSGTGVVQPRAAGESVLP